MSSRLKGFLLILLITLTSIGTIESQGTLTGIPEAFVTIGQPVPNISFPQVMNFSRRTASLQDFKGKLIILDFWGMSCPPCVASLPEMVSLQRKFDGKVQIILVGSEDELTAKRFFARKPNINLPNAVNVLDRLAEQFGVPGLGTYVWIDGRGILRAVTDHEQVTEENVLALLDDRIAAMPSIGGYGHRVKFDNKAPLLLDGNGSGAADLQYHSMITGVFRGGDTVDVRNIDGPYKNRRIFIQNYPIEALYRVAFGQYAPGTPARAFPPPRTLLEVADPIRLRGSDSEHVYCYELIVPIERSSQLFQMMCVDLDRFFGTSGRIESRGVKTLVLVHSDKGRKALAPLESLDPRAVALGFPNGQGHLRISNSDFYYLQGLLEYLLDRPVVDETNLSGTLDVGLSYKELFAEHRGDISFVRNALAEYGIDLLEAERTIDLLVIRDAAR